MANIDPFGRLMESERWISNDKLKRQQVAKQNALQDIQQQSAQLGLTQAQDKQNFLAAARSGGLESALQQYPVIGQSLVKQQQGASNRPFAPVTVYNQETDTYKQLMPTYNQGTGKASYSNLDVPEGYSIMEETPEIERQRNIKAKGAGKFAEMQGSQRSQRIDKAYTKIEGLNKNLINLDNAVDAVKAGAGTGAIAKRFPSIRGTSILLDQVQGNLALDVIGSVTFGALSKGELDLAKDIAIPTGLEGPELIKWLQDKKAAQTKLIGYFNDQINYLDEGGTIAGFLREQKRKNTNVIKFDANGEMIQ